MADEPDETVFQLYRVDDHGIEGRMPIAFAEGERAEALLSIIHDMHHIAEATGMRRGDLRLYEVVRVPVDLDHLGKVQQ